MRLKGRAMKNIILISLFQQNEMGIGGVKYNINLPWCIQINYGYHLIYLRLISINQYRNNSCSLKFKL